MLAECEDRSLVSQCKNCREAILKKDYSSHVAKAACKKAIDMSLRCPLCHNDVEEDEDGWKKHLLGKGSSDAFGCPGNPRKQRKKSISQTVDKPLVSPAAAEAAAAGTSSSSAPPSLKITAPSQDRLAGISDEEEEESPTTPKPSQQINNNVKVRPAKSSSSKPLVSSMKHSHDPSSPPPPRKNVKIILPTDSD